MACWMEKKANCHACSENAKSNTQLKRRKRWNNNKNVGEWHMKLKSLRNGYCTLDIVVGIWCMNWTDSLDQPDAYVNFEYCRCCCCGCDASHFVNVRHFLLLLLLLLLLFYLNTSLVVIVWANRIDIKRLNQRLPLMPAKLFNKPNYRPNAYWRAFLFVQIERWPNFDVNS